MCKNAVTKETVGSPCNYRFKIHVTWNTNQISCCELLSLSGSLSFAVFVKTIFLHHFFSVYSCCVTFPAKYCKFKCACSWSVQPEMHEKHTFCFKTMVGQIYTNVDMYTKDLTCYQGCIRALAYIFIRCKINISIFESTTLLFVFAQWFWEIEARKRA